MFDLQGFRQGLFAYQKRGEAHTYGNSCLPSFSIPNLDTLRCKCAGKKVTFPITQIGENWVVKFLDSEGNTLEMTAPK
ncbi:MULTISPECIES: VOC family protein [Caproicibacterium]|uniref:VOC family protein n=1 Tax=Caproicibacterium TaxID=2834348 RepID=UPI0026D51CB6